MGFGPGRADEGRPTLGAVVRPPLAGQTPFPSAVTGLAIKTPFRPALFVGLAARRSRDTVAFTLRLLPLDRRFDGSTGPS